MINFISLIGHILGWLGIVSGFFLLIHALFNKPKSVNLTSLWSLFIVGTISGIIIIAVT